MPLFPALLTPKGSRKCKAVRQDKLICTIITHVYTINLSIIVHVLFTVYHVLHVQRRAKIRKDPLSSQEHKKEHIRWLGILRLLLSPDNTRHGD